MNGNSIVADTNILLYIFQGDAVLSQKLRGSHFYISFISEIELLSLPEFSSRELKSISRFLSECSIIDINASIKERVIDIRKQYKLKIPDAIIAATSSFLSLPLVTSDMDFQRLTNQDIIFYSR